MASNVQIIPTKHIILVLPDLDTILPAFPFSFWGPSPHHQVTRRKPWVAETEAVQSLTWSWTYHHRELTGDWSLPADRPRRLRRPRRAPACRRSSTKKRTVRDTRTAPKRRRWCWWDALAVSCTWCCARTIPSAPSVRAPFCWISSMTPTTPPEGGTRIAFPCFPLCNFSYAARTY